MDIVVVGGTSIEVSDRGAEVPILSPEKFFDMVLARSAKWLRTTVQNIIAILQWVGLPSAMLSFFTDLKWVADVGAWLVERAGVLRDALVAVGAACVFVVLLWRDFTAPVRDLLIALINIPVPPWAFDLATIAILLAAGRLRAAIRFRAALPQVLQQAGKTPADASYSAHLNKLLREAHRKFPARGTPDATRSAIADKIRDATPDTKDDVARMLGALVMEKFEELFPSATLDDEQRKSFQRQALRQAFSNVVAEQAVGREIERQKANREFALYAACALVCLIALLADWALAGGIN